MQTDGWFIFRNDKLYVKWKGFDSSFNNQIDKKSIVLTSECFPKPKSLGTNVKVQLYLSNYATNGELKNTTVDTSSFA